MPEKFFWTLLVCLTLAACGGGGSDVGEDLELIVPASPPPEPTEPDNTRPFLLAATGVQMLPVERESFRNGHDDFPLRNLASDVDMLVLVADFLGLPVDEFADSTTPPEDHPWTKKVEQLAAAVELTGKPVMLQLGLVRRSMVGRSEDRDGELAIDLTWAPQCLDFATEEGDRIGRAYVNYARWLAGKLKPTHIVNFAEANIYYDECSGPGPSWDKLVEIQRSAYLAMRAELPDAMIFASVHIETLYGDQLDGWDEEQYQDITRMRSDTFSMASYPFGLRLEDGSFVTPYDLPSDYLTRVLDRDPDVPPLSIAETGWNSVSIAAGSPEECLDGFPYSEQSFADAYLNFVINAAHVNDFAFVNWFSLRDSLPDQVVSRCFPEVDLDDPDDQRCGDDFWCLAVNQAKLVLAQPDVNTAFSEVIQKAFGAMGLRDYEGNPRGPLMALWREQLSLEWKPVGLEETDDNATNSQ